MLYTFSHSNHNAAELQGYFAELRTQDAVVLYSDAVLLPIKFAAIFSNLNTPCYALENDITARGLNELINEKVRLISVEEFVELTEKYFPQFDL